MLLFGDCRKKQFVCQCKSAWTEAFSRARPLCSFKYVATLSWTQHLNCSNRMRSFNSSNSLTSCDSHQHPSKVCSSDEFETHSFLIFESATVYSYEHRWPFSSELKHFQLLQPTCYGVAMGWTRPPSLSWLDTELFKFHFLLTTCSCSPGHA